MTNIEQQFFEVFGIEPKYQDACTVEDKYWQNEELANEYGTFDMYMNAKCGNQENCTTQCSCAYTKEIYHKITAEKLLQMICIILNAEGLLTINTEGNIADIKDFVLRFLIGKVNKNNPYCHYKTKNKIKHQIQQLFKGEE